MMDKCGSAAILTTLFLASSAGLCAAQPEELTVFTAASLTGAFTEIGEMYKNETNVRVVFNFDGSQVLRTQIENGAYADVFVSANKKQMNALLAEGLMNNGSITVFTRTKPVIIVPKQNPARIQNVSDLAKPGIKIVIGTKDVPIGDYTLQILGRLANDTAFGPEFREKVTANVVSQETNVNYIVSKVALGEADAGVAYQSDVTRDLAAKVAKISIPDKYNVIAEYPIGVLLQAKYPAEALEFINLIRSEKGATILEKYGFEPMPGPEDAEKAAANTTETNTRANYTTNTATNTTNATASSILSARATAFDAIVKIARTHLQDAVPIRLGQEFTAYGMAVRKCHAAVACARKSVCELGIGGSAAGTGLNTAPGYREKLIEHLKQISGIRDLAPAEDMREAMQSQRPVGEMMAALRSLAIEVSRIANDLRLLASGPTTGFFEIVLPAIAPGSSIMPGKVNPSIPEMVNMVCFQVIGNATCVDWAVGAGQLDLNVMMPVMAHNAIFSIHILGTALRQFTDLCIKGITANEDVCKRYSESSMGLATALNVYVGYKNAAAVAKEALHSRKTIIQVAREKKLLSEEEIARIMDPIKMTEPGIPGK